MSQVVFQTARLFARCIKATDTCALHAVYGDADAMRWVGDGQPITRTECDRWIEVTLNNYRTRGYGMFVLLDRGSGDVVGFCGLVHPDGQAEAEIKYALHRSFWGQGLATEAAAALIAYAADTLGIDYVIATVAPENRASRRVLMKAGMHPGAIRNNDDGTVTEVFEWRK